MDSDNLTQYKLTRLWKGLTMKQIADALNVSPATVSAIENGQRPATPEVRAAYARNFPLDESYFAFVEAYQKTTE